MRIDKSPSLPHSHQHTPSITAQSIPIHLHTNTIPTKVAMWEEAWAAIKLAMEYPEDQDGEVAAAIATNMQAVYESAKAAELQVCVCMYVCVCVCVCARVRASRPTRWLAS
jgi:hypothetical protein